MPATVDASTRRKLTPPQLAELWGVGTSKVLAWIHSGELRAINAATSTTGERPRWLIDPADVERFELSRASAPAKPLAKANRRKSKPADVTTYF